MRYKVTFKGGNQLDFRQEETSQYAIDIYMANDEFNRSGNNIFKNNETKAFDLFTTLDVQSYNEDDDGVISGNSYLHINYAITVHNGEIDLQVKPFKFDPYSLEWELFEQDGNGAGDCEEILSDEVLDIDIDWNFNTSGIKQFLLKHITVEPIED